MRAYVAVKIDFAFRAKIEATGSDTSVIAEFLVVEEGKRSLLGKSTANDLKLLFVGPQINECRKVENEIFPKMPGVNVKFSIDKSIPPIQQAY